MPERTTLDILERLIAFDTTSRESNLELIAFVENYLASLGIESILVPNDEGTKANLFATAGDTGRPGIMLSGHTDVVPVDGQDWSFPPFEMTESGGRLHGRGTADMKGFIAIVLAKLPRFLERGLEIPIHLAFSYDEEIGCLGVRSLIDKMNGFPVKPAMCIVGEPTSMEVVIGHKGKRSYVGHVRGLEAHSSLAPEGVNAVEFASELIVYLRGMAARFAAEGARDELYDVTHTTVHTGTIEGGTALNIVPKDCRFEFEFRYIAEDDPDEIESEFQRFIDEELTPPMHAIDPTSGFSIEVVSDMPGLDLGADEEVVTFVKALAGRNDHAKVAFGTEAGLFQKRGSVPTVVCGPGAIAQAHKPNEFIELAQVDQCEAFMDRLMDKVCGS